jgi:hypothetical protein
MALDTVGAGKWSSNIAEAHTNCQRQALSRPAVSQNGRYVALVSPAQALQIIQLGDEGASMLLYRAALPSISPTFLNQLLVLRWSPTTLGDNRIPRLLLSDGSRLVVINPEILIASDTDTRRSIVADYQLGDQFGRLAYSDFFLSQEHVVVVFEAGGASILSTASAQRDDITNIKFPSSRSFVRSPGLRSLLVLQRNKGQDQATLLGMQDCEIVVQSSFSLPTSDTQGALFSPNQDPVITVWEGSAYGMAVFFFSSMGHPLKQLNVMPFGLSSGLTGLGVSNISWASTTSSTVLAVADNNKQMLIRRQDNRSMSVEDLGILSHPATIDGSKSIVWQETEEGDFSLQKRAFDAVINAQAGGGLAFLEQNADQTFMATTSLDNPRSIWLWQPDHPDPHTVIALREHIRQLLWHPRDANVLVITTHSKNPHLFVWHQESKPPCKCSIPLANTSSSKFEGAWLESDVAGRHPFIMTSTRAVDVGYLGLGQSDGVEFSSLLRDDTFGFDLAGDITSMSTPSKPSKKVFDAGGAW